MSPIASLVLPTDRLPHAWTVAGTVLMGGAVTMAAWWMSTSGLAELAATGLAFWLLTLVRMLSPGLQRLAPGEMQDSARILDTIRRDLAAWTGTRSILSQAILAAAMTALFLILRGIARWALEALSSPILAGALGLAVAALEAAPHLARAIGEAAVARRDGDPEATETEPEEDR